MARELGTFEFPSNFEVKKAGPIDARELVTDINDLVSIPFQYYGQIVRVENVGLFYCSNPGSANIEDWLPVGSGGALEIIEGASDINTLLIKDKGQTRYEWDYDNNGVTALESAQNIMDLSFGGSGISYEEGVNYRSNYDPALESFSNYKMHWSGVPEKIITIGPDTSVSAKSYTINFGIENHISGDTTLAIGSQITQIPFVYNQWGTNVYKPSGGNSVFGHDIIVEGGTDSVIIGNNVGSKHHEKCIIIGNNVVGDQAWDEDWDVGLFDSVLIGNSNEDISANKSLLIGNYNTVDVNANADGSFPVNLLLAGNSNNVLGTLRDRADNYAVFGNSNQVTMTAEEDNGGLVVGSRNTNWDWGGTIIGNDNKATSGEYRKLILGENTSYNAEFDNFLRASIGVGLALGEMREITFQEDFPFLSYAGWGQWTVPTYEEIHYVHQFKYNYSTEYNNAISWGMDPLEGTYWSCTTSGPTSNFVKGKNMNSSSTSVYSSYPTSNNKARLVSKVHPSEIRLYTYNATIGTIINLGDGEKAVVIKASTVDSGLLGKESFVTIMSFKDYTPAANEFWDGTETTFPFFKSDPVRPIATGWQGTHQDNDVPPIAFQSGVSAVELNKAWYSKRSSVFFWDLFNGENGLIKITANSSQIVPSSALDILSDGSIIASLASKDTRYSKHLKRLTTREDVLDLKGGYEVTGAFKEAGSQHYVQPFTSIAYNRLGKNTVPALDPSSFSSTSTVLLGAADYTNVSEWQEHSGSNAEAIVSTGITTVDGIAGFRTVVDNRTDIVMSRGLIVDDQSTTSGAFDIADDTINQFDVFVKKTDDFQYLGMRYHANGTRPWIAFSTHKDSTANEITESSPGAQDILFGTNVPVQSGGTGVYDIRTFGSVSTPNGYNRVQKIDYSDNIWLFRITFTGIQGEGGVAPSRLELAPAITLQSAWESGAGQTANATGEVDIFGLSLVTSDAPNQDVPQLAYYNEIDYIGFSLDPDVRSTYNAPYWGEFEGPTNHTLDNFDGLFSGEYMPGGVDKLFNYDHLWINSVAAAGYSVPTTISSAVRQLLGPNGELCQGSISLNQCRRGDRLEVRFDFFIRVTEACSVDVCLWYQNRNSSDEVTFDFELASTSLKFGAEDVGKTKLQRVPLTAWIATDQDLNAVLLPAIKVTAPCYIQPATMKVNINR